MVKNPITEAEVAQFRADTLGTQFVTHFNNAGAALIPNPVREAVDHYLLEEAKYGGYEAAARFEKELVA
ncbi:MAG: aminotransferase V, partial [Bacteroidota bacterium]